MEVTSSFKIQCFGKTFESDQLLYQAGTLCLRWLYMLQSHDAVAGISIYHLVEN